MTWSCLFYYAAYGYMICSFNTKASCLTMMEIMNDTDYQWQWLSGQSPNYPDSGPLEDFSPGVQSSGYLLMDSSANVVCCHSVIIWIAYKSSSQENYFTTFRLSSSDLVVDVWATAVLQFCQHDKIHVYETWASFKYATSRVWKQCKSMLMNIFCAQ